MIDPKDIRAGGKAVVTVARSDELGAIIADEHGALCRLPFSALSPLATPPPTAAIDAEIVEAAEQFVGKWGARRPISYEVLESIWDLINLFDRRRALLKPKDAVGELLEAIASLGALELSQPLSKTNESFVTQLGQVRYWAVRVAKERGE